MSAQAEQHAFDMGLRAGEPSEQLATISKLSRLFEENPSPTFVNSILLRTADAFKDGKLYIRVAISRALSQCDSHITLAFSSAEIFRRILTVSHSNDSSDREAVLDVLASLSALVPDNHQVHHLIKESLSTQHDGEFRAACHALKAFASKSQLFAENIILQIGKILEEENEKEARKVLLCSVLSTMSATASVVEQVFGIAENILRRTISDEFYHAFLDSTTSLCIETRFAIPKQIDIVLSLLHPDKEKRRPLAVRKLILLQQLKRLSAFPNIWTEKQVKSFVSALSPSLPDQALSDFFDASIALVRNCPRGNLLLLKTLVIGSTGFGSVANPEVSVRFVHLAAAVFCSSRVFEGDTDEFVDSTMTSLTVTVVNTLTCGRLKSKLANRLYHSIGDLLITFPFSQFAFSQMIILAIFSAFDSPKLDDSNQKERLEMLCRLVDTDKTYIAEISKWAERARHEKPALFDVHPNQLTYLCLAVGIEPSALDMIPLSDLRKYETARTALRNGHWLSVAAPNLKAIELYSMPRVEREWISGLAELASSQLLRFDLDAMETQQKHLTNCLSILRCARGYRRIQESVRFPMEMVHAMLQSSYAYFHVLSVIRPFSTFLEGALRPGDAFFNPVVAKRFLAALTPCESTVSEALSEWSSVCRSSFCADPTSFDLITLYYIRVSILQVALKVMLKKLPTDTIVEIPPLANTRTCSLLQRERLQWVVSKIPALSYDTVPNIKTINVLQVIVEQLALIPYMIPRFFFQQFYHVDFKITTTPQPEKEKPISVGSGETIPIRVDGAITSTHPSNIRSIIVIADIAYHANHAHNYSLQETVEPSENQYFTAQFLLNFKAPCDVKIRIEFIDQTSRKQWKAHGCTVIPISVRDPSQSMFRSNVPAPKFQRSIFDPII